MSKGVIIDRMTVGRMLSLLDWCYRLGVFDSRDVDDSGLVEEFCEKVSHAGVFGFLKEGHVVTWREWVLRLLYQAKSTHWNGAMSRFFELAGRFGSNYLSVFYNIAQGFYCKGLRDYKHSDGIDMGRFREGNRIMIFDTTMRRVEPKEYVDIIQMMAFDYERRDTAIIEAEGRRRKELLSATHYEMFRRAIGLASNRFI